LRAFKTTSMLTTGMQSLFSTLVTRGVDSLGRAICQSLSVVCLS